MPPQLKMALQSVLVGFAVSVLTILFQHFISWLQSFDPTTLGAVIGMGRHVASWKQSA